MLSLIDCEIGVLAMDLEAWKLDVKSGTAVHATGFKLVVEGNPANPMGVTPGRFPEGLTAIQQATLLRCGIEALIEAALAQKNDQARQRFSVVAAETAKVTKTKPSRPVLSLKR